MNQQHQGDGMSQNQGAGEMDNNQGGKSRIKRQNSNSWFPSLRIVFHLVSHVLLDHGPVDFLFFGLHLTHKKGGD